MVSRLCCCYMRADTPDSASCSKDAVTTHHLIYLLQFPLLYLCCTFYFVGTLEPLLISIDVESWGAMKTMACIHEMPAYCCPRNAGYQLAASEVK